MKFFKSMALDGLGGPRHWTSDPVNPHGLGVRFPSEAVFIN